MGERHLYICDSAANDSDKSWTVPGNSEWHIDHVYVSLKTTADAGNRLVEVRVTDTGSRDVMYGVADTVLAASSTGHYFFFPDANLDAGFTAERIRCPLFDAWIRPGSTVRVLDNAAVAATADDMEVILYVTQRDVLS